MDRDDVKYSYVIVYVVYIATSKGIYNNYIEIAVFSLMVSVAADHL